MAIAVHDADDEESMGRGRCLGHIADTQAAYSSGIAGMAYRFEAYEQAKMRAHWGELFQLPSTWQVFCELGVSKKSLSTWYLLAQMGDVLL